MRIAKPWARRATASPIRPMPTMPSVAPWTSCPVNMKGVQPRYLPARRKRSASPSRRAVARSRANAPSAVVSSSIPGANVTGMPRSLAAATSMLSYPVPIVAIMRSFFAPRMASPLTGFAGSVYTTSASAIIRATSAAVGMGGSSGPTVTSPLGRRIASASSAIGRVTTIFTSASESMPPQFRRAQTRRGGRGGRAQRTHVGAPREGGHPVHPAAGLAAGGVYVFSTMHPVTFLFYESWTGSGWRPKKTYFSDRPVPVRDPTWEFGRVKVRAPTYEYAHRTADLINFCVRAGLEVDGLWEWSPHREGGPAGSDDALERELPAFIQIRARKPSSSSVRGANGSRPRIGPPAPPPFARPPGYSPPSPRRTRDR